MGPRPIAVVGNDRWKLGGGSRSQVALAGGAARTKEIVQRLVFPDRKCPGGVGFAIRMPMPEVILPGTLNATPILDHVRTPMTSIFKTHLSACGHIGLFRRLADSRAFYLSGNHLSLWSLDCLWSGTIARQSGAYVEGTLKGGRRRASPDVTKPSFFLRPKLVECRPHTRRVFRRGSSRGKQPFARLPPCLTATSAAACAHRCRCCW